MIIPVPVPVPFGKGIEPLTKAAADILTALARPAADEVGGWAADRIRIKRLDSTLLKMKEILEGNRIRPKRVPWKMLFPILEACSLEEEDDMGTRWANLLAAAASGDAVLPSYVAMLANLSPEDARVLDSVLKLSQDIGEDKTKRNQVMAVKIEELRHSAGLGEAHFDRVIVNLQRFWLLEIRHGSASPVFLAGGVPVTTLNSNFLGLTTFGRDFLSVCNAPLDRPATPPQSSR